MRADGADLYSNGSPGINSPCRGLLCGRTSYFNVWLDWDHYLLGQLDFGFEPGQGGWVHIVAVVVRVSDARLFELRKPARDECVTGRGRQRHRVARDYVCDRFASNRDGTDETERYQSMSESHVSLIRLEAIEETLTHGPGDQLSSTSTWHLPMKRLHCWWVRSCFGLEWSSTHRSGLDHPMSRQR